VFLVADLTLVCWALFEVTLLVRDRVRGKGSRERDRATRMLIRVAIVAAILGASVAARRVPSLRIGVPYRAAAVAVMWLGLAIRVWAVATLGSAFRTTVEVDPGQAVVANGPYRWVRHLRTPVFS
jgi:protein-S-isoprenylcysteine O-methyltransferase Ste14